MLACDFFHVDCALTLERRNHPRRVTLCLILQPTARGVAVAAALAGIENLIQPLFSIVAISLGVLCGTALCRGLRFGNTRLRK